MVCPLWLKDSFKLFRDGRNPFHSVSERRSSAQPKVLQMMVLRLRMVVPFFRRRDVLGRHVLLHSQDSSSRRSGRPSDGPGGGKKTLFSSSECTRLRFRYRISISSEITFLMGGLTMSESFCGVDGTGVVVASSLMVMVSMLGMMLR